MTTERDGWVLTAVAVANTALLVFAVAGPYGAPYGGIGVLFLLAHFLLSGVVAGVAVRSALAGAGGAVARLGAVLAGVAVSVLCIAAWGTTPSDEPLLPRVLALIAVPAAVWAVAARPAHRAAAVVAAVALCGLWLLGAVLDS